LDLELAPEHASFRDSVRELAQGVVRPLAAEVDRDHRFPAEAIKAAAESGLMGVLIPREYGGAGMDALAFALCIEELAQACAATAVIVDVHTSVGTEPILLFGDEDQKRKWLPQLASGQLVRVLPGYSMPDADIHWLAPYRTDSPRRIRLLIDFLVAQFQGAPWKTSPPAASKAAPRGSRPAP